MKKASGSGHKPELRRRAEREHQQRAAQRTIPKREEDVLRLVQELQVHQIELELQNEELRQATGTAERALTQLTQAVELQHKLEDQLLQTQKLEALGIMAGGVAHDFNNLLTVILGNSNLLRQEQTFGSPLYLRSLEDIEQASRQAAGLCQQLLLYAGHQPPTKAPLDLSQLLGQMTRLLTATLSRKISLQIKAAKILPPIDADPVQIHQIIMNLVINAAEAIGDRAGTITVSTGTKNPDQAFLEGCHLGKTARLTTYIFLEVEDDGCGMTTEVRSKAFDPFYTTKFQGRGLGLAAVRGIVRVHGGILKIWTEAGKGTRFTILLPASHGAVERPAPVITSALSPRWTGNLLVVDDEPQVLDLTRQMLEHFGFKTTTATDGLAAVTLFRERAREIRGIVLDLAMPGLSGEETFQALRQVRADVPVLISSGFYVKEISDRFTADQKVAFIQKPFDFQTLEHKLREIFNG